MLSTHVPDLQVHVGQADGLDVLANGGDGARVDAAPAPAGGGGGGASGGIEVEVFDGGEEGRFTGVVEAEEEDGVFWWEVSRVVRLGGSGRAGRRRGNSEENGAWSLPSLLVA